MDSSPVYVTFEFQGNLKDEVSNVSLGIKGLRDVSKETFKSLLQSSNEAFSAMSKNNQELAVQIQKDIESLRLLEAAQEGLDEAYKRGTTSAGEYAEAKARLSIQEADLRDGISQGMKTLQESIDADKRQIGSIEEKKAALAQLEEAYQKLSETDRDSAKGEAIIGNIRELKKEIGELDSVLQGAGSSSGSFLSSIESLPGPVGSAATAIGKMTKAAMAFIATPLGLVLAGITGALALVTTWFKRTEEGQNALAVASAAFSQVLNSVLDLASKAGEWLYKAFSDPKTALIELVDFIKGNFMNRLSALSDMGAAIVKIFSKDWKDGFTEFGDAFLKLNTGIDNVRGKALEFMDEVTEKTKDAISLANRSNELEKKQRDFLIERRELEADINRLREDVYDSSKTEKEKNASLAEAIRLNDLLYNKEIAFAKEKRDIIKETNALADSNKADLKAEAEAEAEIHRLEAEKLSNRRAMLRSSQTLTNQMNKDEAKTAVKTLKEELEKKKELYTLYYAFVESAGKESADKAYEFLLKDGESYREYILREIEKLESLSSRTSDESNMLAFLYTEKNSLEGKKTAADLLKEEIEKLKTLYGEDLLTLKTELLKLRENLSDDKSESGVQRTNIINEAITAADKDADKKFKTLCNTYQTGFRKLASLEEDYQNDVALLRSRMTDNQTEEEKKIIEDAITARTEAYRQAVMKESDMFSKLFGDLTRETTKELQAILAWVSSIDISGMSAKDIKVFKDGVRKLEEELRERNPFKQLNKDFDALVEAIKNEDNVEDALSRLENSFNSSRDYVEKLGESLTQVFGDDFDYAISQALELGESVFNLGKGLTQLYSGDILGGIQSLAAGIGTLFSMGKKVKEMNRQAREEQQKFYDEAIKGEREYIQLLRERLRTQQEIGESSLSYNKRITAELEKQQKSNLSEYNKLMAELQGESYVSNVNYKHGTWFRKAKTTKEYESLAGKSYEDIEKLYTQGKLEEKVAALFEQLRSLKEEGVDINQMLADQAEAMREIYTGTTSDAIADSIVSGFLEGKRSAEDFADDFEEMMKNAVLQGIKLQALEEPLRQWYESFAEASGSGLTAEKMEELRKQYEKIITDASRQLEEAEKITGLSFSAAETASTATAKGFTSMSQDSADALDGKFTAMLIYMDKITGPVTGIYEFLQDGLIQINEIAENTSYCKRLEGIDKSIEEINGSVKEMLSDGLFLKR